MRRHSFSPMLAIAALASCSAAGSDDAPPSTWERAAEIALFPINVVPDIVGNTAIYASMPLWMWTVEDPGNLWPIVWLGSPIVGPIGGVLDAWHGYPFWDPIALDEHRSYGR